MLIATSILGIGHIGIHLQHKKRGTALYAEINQSVGIPNHSSGFILELK